MLHALKLWNEDLDLLRAAVERLTRGQRRHGAWSGPAPDGLKDKLAALRGGQRELFDSGELRAMYSGLAVMEYLGWTPGADADGRARERFRGWQDRLRGELAAAGS